MSKIPGDFVPLDVRYRRDRAIRSAGIAGELLYVRSLAHAKCNDTGGVIEDYDLPDLTSGMADGPGTAAALVRVGLWVVISPTSWAIRSWDKWNPASDRSTDGRLGNHKRWHRDRGIVAPDCEFCIPQSLPDIAPESPPISGGESQTRVEESRREESREAIPEESPPPPKPKRGTRIPDNWEPPEDARRKMADRFPHVDLDIETEKFINHWQAESGQKATKSNWTATWRNWIINADGYTPRHLRAVKPEQQQIIDGPPKPSQTGLLG